MSKEVRFYKGNRATILWDPNRNRPIADFSEGHFTTSDERAIKAIKEAGYEEIALNALEPPYIADERTEHIGDIDSVKHKNDNGNDDLIKKPAIKRRK